MTVFFTGHRGFLGRELIPELELHEDLVFFDGDLTDYDAVKNFIQDKSVTRIIHAASRGGRRNKVDTHETLLNNVRATTNVLRFNLPTILFCSGAIYNREESVDNALECNSLLSFPVDYYGQSKFIANSLAKNTGNSNILRYFNVFGPSEGLDRFISFNVSQYIKHKPMKIFKDFEMDFFYVQDTLPVLTSWLNESILPNEINMVYRSKMRLSDVCELINSLSNHTVPIHVLEEPHNKNYTGNGQILDSLQFTQVGLQVGIECMYESLRSNKR